jgi:hypothetical protein
MVGRLELFRAEVGGIATLFIAVDGLEGFWTEFFGVLGGIDDATTASETDIDSLVLGAGVGCG